MRIIAGQLGGRQFTAPKGHRTRPMSDKVRGALFNTLGDIAGLSLLDPFAGSGALCFESLSRGASRAVAIDSDKVAQRVIAENAAKLGLQNQLKLIRASATAWLSTTSQTFDLVLCDPPYNEPQPALLAKLSERVKPGGTIVLSLPPALKLKLPEAYELLVQKKYGDATLSFYRRTQV